VLCWCRVCNVPCYCHGCAVLDWHDLWRDLFNHRTTTTCCVCKVLCYHHVCAVLYRHDLWRDLFTYRATTMCCVDPCMLHAVLTWFVTRFIHIPNNKNVLCWHHVCIVVLTWFVTLLPVFTIVTTRISMPQSSAQFPQIVCPCTCVVCCRCMLLVSCIRLCLYFSVVML